MLIFNREEYRTINFEETELRLGLPGNNHETAGDPAAKKRGFSETETDEPTSVNLKLNLSMVAAVDSKMIGGAMISAAGDKKLKNEVVVDHIAKPPAKAQVVGWPPVRSFRKNIVSVQKKSSDEPTADQKATASAAFVKVSMDGAPYLRKVDLKLYATYQELSAALAKMFCSFTTGNCGWEGGKDLMKESKLIDVLNGSDYVASYEDKDGDWMLVGDVPWEMFVNSCKRLRIMKGAEAIGLAPRAVEKCKGRF